MIDSQIQTKTRFPWGWIVVAVTSITMFGFYGASGSFGIFLKPMLEELDLTRASISSAMSTMLAASGIAGIISGRMTDKYGPRIVIGVGGFLGFLGYLLMYQASSLWQMHIFFGILVGASMGTCFTPIIATVSKWFTEKRVLAVGIVSIGIAIGQMSIPVIAAYIVASSGWRPAFIVLAVVVLITTIPSVIFLGRKPPQNAAAHVTKPNLNNSSETAQEASRHSKGWSPVEAVRTLPFWMFVIVGFVTALGFYILMVHIVAFAIDLGTISTDAALILTFFNIGNIGAQILVWFLARKFSSRFTIIIMQGLQALCLFSLMGASSFSLILILGTIIGIGFGGSNTIRLSMISEVFGTRSAGAIIGLVSVAWAVGGMTGPILAGYIFDVTHSYNIAFLIGGLLLTIGATAGYFLRAPRSP